MRQREIAPYYRAKRCRAAFLASRLNSCLGIPMSNSVAHFFTSLFAKILFGILIVAFGAWGVADMLRRSPAKQAVITVGDSEISTLETKRAFVNELRRLRQNFGPQLTATEAEKFGVFDQVLSQLVSRTLLEAAAKKMNVGAGDAAIQALLRDNPAFKGEDGNFSLDRFKLVLANNGYHEKDFIQMVRSDLTRQRILDSVRKPVVVPNILAETLLRYEAERRVFETFTVRAADQPVPAAPADDVLEAFQKAHAADYTAPEYRKLTILMIRPDDVKSRITLTDEDLQTYFDQHASDFAEPEKRKLRQVLLKDEAAAQKVAAAIREGRAVDAAAKDAGAAVTDLGWVGRDGLMDALARPVFDAKKGAVLDPLKTALGWHVFVVEDVRAATTPTLAAVHDKLVEAARADRILNAVYQLSTTVEDAIAAGASLEDAAKSNGLATVGVETDAKGEGLDGKAAKDLPAIPEILKTAFAQDAGTQSGVVEYEGEPGGYFVSRTDAATPAALRPFATVKDKVLAAWRHDQQQQAAAAKAKSLADAFAETKDAAGFAKTNHVAIDTGKPIYRSGASAGLPRDLVHALFAADPGQTATAATDDGVMVGRLQSIVPVDLAAFASTLEQGKRSLGQTLGDSLMVPFSAQLTETFEIRQFRSVQSLVQELN